MIRVALPALAATLLAAAPVAAQMGGAPAGALRQAPSTRSTAEATLNPPRVQGQPAPTPLKIRVDYGQPHARGRKVVGGLIPVDTVWRFGANAATGFTTDVDLDLGGKAVPKGAYTLFSLLAKDGSWSLIVSKKTGEWGTQYDPKEDLVRIPVKARTLAEAVESFTVAIVPAGDGSPKGVLRFAWGTAEGSVEWAAKP
jgi:hypothetical protein